VLLFAAYLVRGQEAGVPAQGGLGVVFTSIFPWIQLHGARTYAGRPPWLGLVAAGVGYRREGVVHEAVIFDLVGVVLESPLREIARYEEERGIPRGFINRLVVETGPEGAWSRHERGELRMEEFQSAFERECRAAGHAISGEELMGRIGRCRPRPPMLRAIARIRTRAIRVAALTNNWAGDGTAELREAFDVFVESSAIGLRKPDPRIYRHVCAELGVEPEEAVFLDDIGRNLKTARALGMTTIKVDEPDSALEELSRLLGFPLR
jgi:putative hydrolase of the HAD superfamily